MVYDIITKKQNGSELTREEWFEILSDSIAIEQLAAFLMVIKYVGLSYRETADLTDILASSGTRFDCFCNETCVDLHSTGGVGDKCTLIACPIVVSLGIKVPKMAGRALGNTGGTIDKLEKSFAGINLRPSPDEFCAWVEKTGFAIAEQTEDFTPLDGKLYVLRSRTGSASCMPLIASSIMSKKIAIGARNIVLNVTYGNGALMKEKADAESLADMMIKIGENMGRKVAVVYTNMDYPLGRCVGNEIEVYEAIKILSGEWGGAAKEVSFELAAKMIELVTGEKNGEELCQKQIDNGQALGKLKEFVETQGGQFKVPEVSNIIEVEKGITAIECAKIAREGEVMIKQ